MYSIGLALLLAYFFGIFGADKFYLGMNFLGLTMLILTLTIVGLIITVPWSFVNIISLLVAIFIGSVNVFGYRSIKWNRLNNFDYFAAIFVGALTIAGIVFLIRDRVNGNAPELLTSDPDDQLTERLRKSAQNVLYLNPSYHLFNKYFNLPTVA